MKIRPLAALLLLVGVTPLVAQGAGNGLEVRPDPQNVAANVLPGTWRADEALTNRLGGTGIGDQLEFRADAEVAAKVPPAMATKLRERRIYLAGTMTLRGARHAFLLTEVAGNATVVWFRERDGDPMGDAESFTVMLVRAEARAKDLLFVGGDFDNQPFSAYGRAAVVAALEPAAALTEMLRLLEAGRHLEMMKTFMSPNDRARIEERGQTLEELAESFAGDQSKRMLDALRRAVKQAPTMSEDGNRATWEMEVEGRTRPLQLQRIEGRWYVLDR